MPPLLEIVGLTLTPPGRGARPVLDDVSLRVDAGETLGLVGESGAGKSIALRAVLGDVPRGWTVRGAVRLAGRDVLGLPPAALARLRREEVAMVHQDPRTAIDPLDTIGAFLLAGTRAAGVPDRVARPRALALLEEVGIPDPRAPWGVGRTRSRAGCCSASCSPRPCSATRSCCWPTSPRRRST